MDPIRRVPVVEQVESSIREMIEKGEFAAGEKLPTEMELCQRFGVGRGTVREAYRLWQAGRIVEIKPGRGAFVAEHIEEAVDAIDWLVDNEKMLLDAFEVRLALEPVAARLMTECRTEEDCQMLREIHEGLLAAIKYEPDAIGSFDERFHSAIVERSQNILLKEVNENICRNMKIFRSKTFMVEQNIRNVIEPHTQILQAIISGDSAAAEVEMRKHLNKAKEDLILNTYRK